MEVAWRQCITLQESKGNMDRIPRRSNTSAWNDEGGRSVTPAIQIWSDQERYD